MRAMNENVNVRPSSRSSVRSQSSAESVRKQDGQQNCSTEQAANCGLRKSERIAKAPQATPVIIPMEIEKSAANIQKATADSRRAAGDSQMAAGDSQMAAGDSQMAAGDSQMAAGDSQMAAGDSQMVAGDAPESVQQMIQESQEATPVIIPLQTSAGNIQQAAGSSQVAAETEMSVRAKQTTQEWCSSRRSGRIAKAAIQRVSARLDMLNISRKSEGALQQQKKTTNRATRRSAPGDVGPSTSRTSKPNTRKLVMLALGELKSRKGVSLAAIVRHASSKLGPRADCCRPLVRRLMLKMLQAGTIVKVKGKGLNGSFKVAQNGAKMRRSNKSKSTARSSGKVKTKKTAKAKTSKPGRKPTVVRAIKARA